MKRAQELPSTPAPPKSREGKEKAWGPEHTSTLDTVHNSGTLYADQGKMAEVEKVYHTKRNCSRESVCNIEAEAIVKKVSVEFI